jgi:serine/threonine protein kinase
MPLIYLNTSTPTRLGVRHARDFSFKNLVGEGGMGRIYRERGLYGKEIAVKTRSLPTPLADFLLRNEARVLSRLRHPKVIAYYGQGETDRGFFLAMEKFEGEDLGKFLARRSGIPLLQALQLTRDIALALAHMHDRGLVHVDLKPGNVLINRSGIRLIDFAFARPEGEWLEIEAYQGSGHLVSGTLGYMLPDRLLSDRPPDKRDDIAALGYLLFEMLTGKKAIFIRQGQPPEEALETAYLKLGSRIHALRLPREVKTLLFRMTGIFSIIGLADCRSIVRCIDGITSRPASVFLPEPPTLSPATAC